MAATIESHLFTWIHHLDKRRNRKGYIEEQHTEMYILNQKLSIEKIT